MIHVLGANIAALTFCDELSRCATPVEIIPLGSPGSGWAGLTRHGELLDLGQRYFELGFEANEEKPLAQYNEAESQRDFVHHVRDFIERHGFTLEEARVESYFRGRIITCPLETTDLADVIDCLTQREKEDIISDLSRRKRDESLEMSRIGYGSAREFNRNLQEMLDYNHGSTFNNLVIYPFVERFGQNLREVPMRMRRKLWAPIFFSDTIVDFCQGRGGYKPKRPHYKLKGHSNSKFVNGIARVAAGPKQKIIELRDGHFLLDGGAVIPIEGTYLGSSLQAISGVIGAPLELRTVKIRLIWFRVDQSHVLREIDYLSVIDPDIPFSRVSCSSRSVDPSKVLYCVETFDMEVDPAKVLARLQEMGLVSESCQMGAFCDLSAPVLDEPTFENERRFNAKLEDIRAGVPDLNMHLAGLIFGRNTFNDQVLIALKMARELRDG